MIYGAMLASNYKPEKLRFPLGAQPKIDGVRGLNMDGTLRGRSKKCHANIYTTAIFSKPEYVGLDGELAAQEETHPKLCRLTSSAMSRIDGVPFVLWHVFDLITAQTLTLPYEQRYAWLKGYVQLMNEAQKCGRLRVVPMQICNNLQELEHRHQVWLDMGYEGTIIRDLNGMHKQGRSTVREMGLLRIKDFIEEEFIITGITEGNRNDNVAQVNENGKTFRTSHQENKVPNGQVGSIQGTILKDSDLFKSGQPITVSTGTLTEAECIYYFQNPHLLINQIGKFRHFPKGVKDKPRFPQFQSIRSKEDM
jgi:DNA ligase-1